MKTKILSVFLVSTALLLSACEKTREQFDFSKKAPDEFAVTTRAPLEMPPDYNLRPPRPGAPRPQEDTAVTDAKQAIFGEETLEAAKTSQPAPMTSGEAILLQKSNATGVDPNIRQKIDQETAEVIKEQTPTFDRLMGKVGRKVDAPATVVDPVKESERIIQNKEAGKPITDGTTPTIKQ